MYLKKLSTISLRTSILFPLILVLIFLLLGFIYSNFQQEKAYKEEFVGAQFLSAKHVLDSAIEEETNKLSSLLEVISKDASLKRFMIEGNQAALLQQSQSLFNTLSTKYDITHFYFHSPEKVNFLRVHKPERFGDKINRHSILHAEATAQPASALELGMLGLLTLRVVFPWYENEKLIGYMELGEEIEHIYNLVKDVTGVEIYILIDKEHLHKDDWEAGLEMIGRQPNWDLFPESVLAFKTSNESDEKTKKHLSNRNYTQNKIIEISEEKHIFQTFSFALSDLPQVKGAVGSMFLSRDITTIKEQSNQQFLYVTILGVFISILLIMFFFWLTRRVENRLRFSQKELYKVSERLLLHFEQSPLAIIEWDLDFKVVEWNPSAEAMFGYTKNEALGVSGTELIIPENLKGNLLSLWNDIISKQDGYHSINENITKEGEVITCEWHNTPLVDEKGKVVGVSAIAEDVTEKKQAEQKVARMAYYDALTGLPNRTLFSDRLAQACRLIDRDNHYIGVLFMDMDHFKDINDTMGHLVGDLLLTEVAHRLKEGFRSCDTVSRFGGDEFAVILTELTHVEEIEHIIKSVQDKFKDPCHILERDIFVTFSVGFTYYPLDDENADNLLRNADTAMYAAKSLGRNGYQRYSSDMTDKASINLSLQDGLRRAIKEEELLLHYQPKIDIQNEVITGVEALVRWQDPNNGLRAPAEFIPVAEETGLIVPMGEWILRTACNQAKLWLDEGMSKFTVAINLSSRQFKEDGFTQNIINIINETGVNPSCIEFELTESILIENAASVSKALNAFKKVGISLSIDDFGTGYSSLSYLKLFPIDKLKIDQSFVRDITIDKNDASLVRAIISMSRSLGLKTIAEGVETQEQFDFLQAESCEEIQGYFIAKPMPAEELQDFLQHHQKEKT